VRRLALSAAAALVALAPPAAHAAGVAATAPTQTVRVAAKQRIGYRAFGAGRPVVFIQGLAGTMDAWPPSFLDSVAAAHHRVIVFDNEGIGRSTLRPGVLSIRRMAQDTARLVAALHLKRPDVVGWSMGGMTAQSFAVNYPKRLRRLVLMATAPGDGKATLPDAAALQELASGDATALLGRLFPPDEIAARDRYISDILRRFDFNAIAPPAVVTAQLRASANWITGGDPDGAKVARIRARTLVGGGELDTLLPVANQRHLAQLIPHAKLVTYPDAAHGFFFQHDADFVPRLVAFLR
jgi:pimeloyl-ACP methyl ester carboxylesterase